MRKGAYFKRIDIGAGVRAIGTEGGQPNHPVLIWLATLGPSSRRAMVSALRRGLRTLQSEPPDPISFDWGGFDMIQLLRIKVSLEGRGSVASRNLTLTAFRGVSRSAWQSGIMPLETLERIRSVKNFRQLGDHACGRSVTRAERTRLMRLEGVHPTVACRDRALIGLMLAAGLRRSEAASLTRAQIHHDEQLLVVTGKGGRVRRIPLSTAAVGFLHAWETLLLPDCKFLFPRMSRAGKVLNDIPMTGTALAMLLQRRSRDAGVLPIRPHDLRRTHATDALESGCDLLALQGVLGHSSPAVTARYDRRGEASRRAVVESVFIPVPDGGFGRPTPQEPSSGSWTSGDRSAEGQD